MPDIKVDDSKFQRKIALAIANPSPALAEITVEGKAKDYWGVWEFGGRNKEAGPRTRKGGDGRIYSRQAPKGYVFKYQRKFFQLLKEEYVRIVKANRRPPTHAELAAAANRVTEQALELIKATVPVDTGQLQESIDMNEAT